MAETGNTAIFGREFSIGLLAHLMLPFAMAAIGLPHLDVLGFEADHPHP